MSSYGIMPYEGTLEQWKADELVILRNIARKVGAWLMEPDDKAMAGTLEEVRALMVKLHRVKSEGHLRGWQ